jgi:hypothetical protein
MQSLFKSILLCILLLGTPCFASDDPSLVSYPPTKPLGFLGLDTQSSDIAVQDGRAEDLQNVKISQAMNLKKRYGYDTVNDLTLDDLDMTNPPIEGIFDAHYSNGNEWPVIFVGNKAKYDSVTSWATVNGVATIESNANYQWKCVMALDKSICTNNYNIPLSIDSTPTKSLVTFTGLGNYLYKAKDVIYFRNYLIFVNTLEAGTANPTRFRWSNVGTINTWSNDDYTDIATYAGDEIIGVSELYGDIYLFLKSSIWRVTLIGGDDVFSYQKIVDNVGAIARDSIQNLVWPNNKQGIVFLAQDKRVYLFDGISVTDIGRTIQPTLDDISASRLQYAVSTYDYENYYLAATPDGGSQNTQLLVYNVKIGEWYRYSDINVNAFGRVEDSNVIKTYFGNYDAFVYWMDDPDKKNDVDGAQGIIDGVAIVNTDVITGGVALYDLTMPTGVYTGATVKITSGTGAGQEAVISSMTGVTGIVVTAAFGTTPDETSIYSIGAIDAYYHSKWFDFGDNTNQKIMRNVYFWAEEASDNAVDVDYAIDFGTSVASETVDLAPSSNDLWDSGVWDEAIWASTGQTFGRIDTKGEARYFQVQYSNDNIDETFNIYGYNIQAVMGEVD